MSSDNAAANPIPCLNESGEIQITNKKYISSTHKHKIENIDDSTDGSEEDVLHVVTNVYTIPIIKSNSAGNGPFIQQSQQEIHTSASIDEDLLNRHMHASSSIPIVLGEPSLDLHSKSCTNETVRIKRVIDSVQQTSNNEIMPTVTSQIGHDVTKSKFQIRSIVEIYENQGETNQQQQQQKSQDLGFFKTSTQYNETTSKEVIKPINLKGKNKKTVYVKKNIVITLIICKN